MTMQTNTLIQAITDLAAERDQLRAQRDALQAQLDAVQAAAAPKRWIVVFPHGGDVQQDYPNAINAPGDTWAVVVESPAQPAAYQVEVRTYNSGVSEWSEATPVECGFSLLP